MKRMILAIVTILSIGFMWFDLLNVDAQNVNTQSTYMAIDPQRAVLCAVIAAVAGIIIYLIRHRENIANR